MEESKAKAWKYLARIWRNIALDAMHAEAAALEEAQKKTEALIELHERLERYESCIGTTETQ